MNFINQLWWVDLVQKLSWRNDQHDQIQAVFHSPAEACMAPWLKAYIEKQEWWKVPGTACKYENKIYLNDQIALPRNFVRPHPIDRF